MKPIQRELLMKFFDEIGYAYIFSESVQFPPVSEDTHRGLFNSALKRSHVRVPQKLLGMARARAGTNTLEDDKEVYRALQLFILQIRGEAMSRKEAIELARKIGSKHGAAEDFGFRPGSPLYQNWYPDEWVIEAMVEASIQ